MALGTNRDYKTADRRARQQLARHKEIMDRLLRENPVMTRAAASDTALRMLEAKRLSRKRRNQ